MKDFLTVALLIISLASVCQDLAFIKKSLDLIETPVEFKPDSTGLFKLPQLNYSCLANIMNDDRPSQNCLQLIDLDSDTQKDILFSGPCNPYPQVGIFLNRGSYFQSVFDRGGEIVDFEQKKGNSTIYVLYQGCCGDLNNEIIEVTIEKNGGLFSRTIEYFESTRPTGKSQLTELVIAGILRKAPLIDDSPYKDPYSDQTVIGNQIIKWDKPKKVMQLEAKGDWSLILAEKEENVSVLGWIMTR